VGRKSFFFSEFLFGNLKKKEARFFIPKPAKPKQEKRGVSPNDPRRSNEILIAVIATAPGVVLSTPTHHSPLTTAPRCHLKKGKTTMQVPASSIPAVIRRLVRGQVVPVSVRSVYAINSPSASARRWKDSYSSREARLRASEAFIKSQVPIRLAKLYMEVVEHGEHQAQQHLNGTWTPYSRILNTCLESCEHILAHHSTHGLDWSNVRFWKTLRGSYRIVVVVACLPACLPA
jgi:hypothetical protein